ncbi:MAG: hypothetical protein GY710_26855 [Desulfobacteraceae bacterium]|nr:hypothetical protein [Desulfobacteraceae bacterium]
MDDYFGYVAVDTIARKVMGQYKQDIMKLPPNMNKDKRYKNLTIHEVIALKLSKTIAVYMKVKIIMMKISNCPMPTRLWEGDYLIFSIVSVRQAVPSGICR